MESSYTYQIRDGKVILPETKWFPKREVGSLTDETRDEVLNRLRQNFAKLSLEVDKLEFEFEEADELATLASRISKVKSDLCSEKAIGPFTILLTSLDEMEKKARNKVDSIIVRKQEICNKLLQFVNPEDEASTASVTQPTEVSKQEESTEDSKAVKNEDVIPVVEGEDVIDEPIVEELPKEKSSTTEAESKKVVKRSITEWNQATKDVMALQKEFKMLPQVPDPRDEKLRKKLNTLVNAFFNEKQKNYDNFEHELLDNLSKKIDLSDRAERLKDSTDWRKTGDEFKQISEEWFAVGPIPRHRSEELWNKFNIARNTFYKNRKSFYNNLIKDFEKNLVQKEQLIVKAEAIKDSTKWSKTTEEMEALMKAWKEAGPVGKKKGDEVWKRFKAARDVFYTNKKEHFGARRESLNESLKKKTELAELAESLKESEDWDMTTTKLLDMMTQWKASGFAPKKKADALWERFISAHRHFFDRKDKHFADSAGEILEEVNNKIGRNIGAINKLQRELDIEQEVVQDFESRLSNLAPSPNSAANEERYKLSLTEAQEKVKAVQEKINKLQERIDIDKKERGRLRWKMKQSGVSDEEINKSMRKGKPAASSRGNKRSEPKETLLGARLKGLNLDNLD